MKSPILFILFIAFAMTSCGTAGSTSKAQMDYGQFQNLAEILRTEPGLNVVGSGGNVKIYIRGISTITLDTQPLFIVDDVRLGTSYAAANNAIQPQNIKSIRVLRSKSETTIYGESGNNGVVIITTKTAVR